MMGSENKALWKLTENPTARLRWNKYRFDIYIEVNKAHMRRYKQQLDVKKSEVKNICNVFPYAD